ncbi:putative exopolysaccharide biosynthesis protein [Selenomonas ruminantium subsp. lactilytica TAM6421]|uniref:Putative exopolysaccharide biosynthesis protein n=1 Tax=Selenomonas ruminantium subsp. lactilytica (strain NBRC 103574 / TAM6421) TaxID=927704 RepID=I0GRR3_SELRL|nr:GNVR domain-containing protein [Selenomonas ruminantium]BAL83450.1 putative exopolysaccharide biosynthesis protein [Selenomonas ruminantium subsp. lactilytica TAM6421]
MDDKEVTIDLREVWDLMVTGRMKIAKITALFLVAAGAYLLITPPTYQSTSLLRIKQEKGLGDSILSSVAGNAGMTTQRMNTNAEILKSRNVIEPVIEKTEEPNKDGKLPSYEGYIKSHVTTKPFKDTEILQVDVTGKSPEQAQEANQLIVDGFLSRLAELSHAEQGATRAFLEERVESSKKELSDAEDKLQKFQVENKLFSTQDQIKQITDKLSIIDKEKAANKLNLEQAQAALGTINGQLDNSGRGIADSAALQQYKVQLAQLAAEKAGYTGIYTEDHEKMQAVNQKIANVQASMEKEIGSIVARQAPSSSSVQQKLLADKFQNEAMVAVEQAKAKALAALDKENEDLISKLPEKEQGYVRVKRDTEVAQEIYVMLAKRLEEAKIAENMVPTEVQVVDSATLPEEPIKPKKAMTMLVALLLGLLTGSAFVTAKGILNRRMRTTEDVEHYLELPVLGIIPDANGLDKEEDIGLLEGIRNRLLRRK